MISPSTRIGVPTVMVGVFRNPLKLSLTTFSPPNTSPTTVSASWGRSE
jgi:hypothetical protein